MSDVTLSVGPPARGSNWKWWVCGLLLLATMLNYMDRLTLNLMAVRIMDDFQLDERHYGQLESAFAFAFALGAIVVGWMADRWNVRWIYPIAVLAWSAAGFATGLADGFVSLLLCRFLLGLAEAGNWPCALRTTQHILSSAERTLGNSILQSGASIGAILTPLIVLALVPWTGTWRYPFLVIGILGMAWAVIWLLSVRREDLALSRLPPSSSLATILVMLIGLLGVEVAVRMAWRDLSWLPADVATQAAAWGIDLHRVPLFVKLLVSILGIGGVFFWLRSVTRDDTALPRRLFFRRFWVLVSMVVAINVAWHFFRAWLPLFLQKQHEYSEAATGWFIMAYYVVTDLGALSAGFATLALVRRGLTVHGSRIVVFTVCAVLTCLSVIAANLPEGWVLLGVLLVIGFGALGLFPVYYSCSQEITVRHQGKVTGALGCINWLAMSVLHELVGDSIKRTGSYSQGVTLAGLVPLIGVFTLICFWGKSPEQQHLGPPEPEGTATPGDDRIKEASSEKIQQ